MLFLILKISFFRIYLVFLSNFMYNKNQWEIILSIAQFYLIVFYF